MHKQITQQKAASGTFAGVWRSHYVYHHQTTRADIDDEHYVRIHRAGKHIVVETIPGLSQSYFVMRLTQADDRLLTGTWQQETELGGEYGGMVLYGAIQLIIDDNKHMHGQWVGFVPSGLIDNGPIDLTYIGEELPAGASEK
jgi:hypothetical protein